MAIGRLGKICCPNVSHIIGTLTSEGLIYLKAKVYASFIQVFCM